MGDLEMTGEQADTLAQVTEAGPDMAIVKLKMEESEVECLLIVGQGDASFVIDEAGIIVEQNQ